MSLGFEQAGFEVAIAVDFDPVHVATHRMNFPRCQTKCLDLMTSTGEDILRDTGISAGEIDIVFGGPPCQGFSFGGKRLADDPRNLLISRFGKLVMELRPRYFVMENVHGLLTGQSRSYIDSLIESIEPEGYSVEPLQLLNALDFGVPQNRRRLFLIGHLKTCPCPEPVVKPKGPSPTVWDALSDLPNFSARPELFLVDEYDGPLGEPSGYARILRRSRRPGRVPTALTGCLLTRHSDLTKARFSATAPGSVEPVSRFFRLPTDGAARTIRAGTTKEQGSFTAPRPIHPKEPRCITTREAARLHSFPIGSAST